jgi:hypothetical protein
MEEHARRAAVFDSFGALYLVYIVTMYEHVGREETLKAR